MTCAEARPLLSALHDRELEPAWRDAVSSHASACPACRDELDALRAVAASVGRDAVPLPDAAAWAAFDRRLAAGLARERAPGGRRERVAALVALAAGVLLAARVGLSLAEPAVVIGAEQRLPRALELHRDPEWAPSATVAFAPDAATTAALASCVSNGLSDGPSSQAALATFLERGLVQTPSGTHRLADLYPSGPTPLPPLATADASLLLYGAAASRAALALEADVLRPDLRALLDALVHELGRVEARAWSSAVRDAAGRAQEIVAVAAALEGRHFPLPAERAARVHEEAARVGRAEGVAFSPLLGRDVDYRALRPRGVYAQDLRAHARAAGWLVHAWLGLDRERPGDARTACVLVLALSSARLGDGRTGLEVAARLEAAIEVLYGEPDELAAFDLLRSLREVLGVRVRASDLAGDAAVGAVADRAALESAARGFARVRGEGEASRQGPPPAGEPGAPPALFRLLGGTRGLETQALDLLVAPAVPARRAPSALDVLALLGSRRARTAVSAAGADAPGYDAALAALAERARLWTDPSLPVAVRTSLERARLFAAASLLEHPASGPVPLAGAPGYRDRLLLAAFAGLNAPAASDDAAVSGEPEAGPLPVVEPLPALHARLAFSARRLAAALDQVAQGRPAPRVERAREALRRVARLEEALRDASLDVLAGRPPAPGPAAELRRYASTLRRLGPADARSAEDLFVLEGPGGRARVLHRVVHRLDRLVAVGLDPWTGRPCLAAGAALCAAEVWTDGERLAPADLGDLAPPDPPWAMHVVAR